MTNRFKHSGATGDLIFSLPTIKAMGGGKLYIYPYHLQRAESVAKLVEVQDYITEVEVTDNIPSDCINLDLFRNFAGHHENLIRCHLKAQGISDETWVNGWLDVKCDPPIIDYTYSIINTGQNYCDPNFDWNKEIDYLLSISDVVYYLGYESEYEILKNDKCKFWDCDFLVAAEMIKYAVMFTGGYSALSTIAMGLGRSYRMVQAPGHTCSSLLMEREKIINV